MNDYALSVLKDNRFTLKVSFILNGVLQEVDAIFDTGCQCSFISSYFL